MRLFNDIDNLLTAYKTCSVANEHSAQLSPLEALLHEVIILANQIKKASFHSETQQMLPAPSKATLQDILHLGPQTVPDLARVRSSSRQNMQVIVNRLERLGYVISRPNPAHKKADLVTITGEGVKLLEQSEREQFQLIERLRTTLPETAVEQTLFALRKLKQALEDNQEVRPIKKPKSRGNRQSIPSSPSAPILQPLAPAAVSQEEETTLPYNLL